MLLVLMLLVNVVVGYDHSVNYWQAFAPGQLLQRLDTLTSSADQLSVELPRAQAKLDEDADSIEATDVDDDAEAEGADSHSVEAHSGEDYERNYEQFVRAYFDRADSTDSDEALDESVETQAEASNVQPSKKKKKKQQKEQEQQNCRQVQRQGQLCKICREPRNNEVSETCSYSHEAEPERYAYGSGTKYKRYRDNDEEEPTRRRRRQQQTKAEQQRERLAPEAANSSSSSLCTRRLVGKSVCYDCKDSGGQRLRRCYDTETNKLSSSNLKQPNGRETAKKEQRIYKRTISYSYQQNDNDDEDDLDTLMTTAAPPATTPATTPSVIHRRLARIVRRRLANSG